MMFSQILGGTVFISVAQNVFQNQLINHLRMAVPGGLDEQTILDTGVTVLASTCQKTICRGWNGA